MSENFTCFDLGEFTISIEKLENEVKTHLIINALDKNKKGYFNLNITKYKDDKNGITRLVSVSEFKEEYLDEITNALNENPLLIKQLFNSILNKI